MVYRISVIIFAAAILLVGIAAISSNQRAYVAGKYAIELDGIMAGWLHTAEGGHATSDVIDERLGPDQIIKKHISGVKYEDITVNCGTGMSKGFYEWIKASFDRKYSRKNGAIIAADYDTKEVRRLSFFEGLITEVGFPACDGASKDPAYMVLKFSPESTQVQPGSGKPVQISASVQKKWLPANFRLNIDGLDCTRVNKIEALTVKQKVIQDPGTAPVVTLEVPNLVITLADAAADSFYKWHEDFVIKGNNGDDKEKGGALEYLAPDLKEVLFSLSFAHIGIFKLSPDKVESGSENIRRVKAEMYCEDMKFNYGTGVSLGVR